MPALLKRFALIYLPIVMVLSVALLMGIRLEEQIHVKEIEGREIAEVGNAQELVTRDLAAVDSDLRVFAKLPLLRWYLDSGNPAQREELEKLFLVLAREMRRYDQVRYLDASGQEVIRINYNDGKPAIAPREQLQNKSGRYYFDDTLKLNRGEIFVSPLDLNIEQGSLEIPYKPTIRFGTPVFDSAGRKKGIILFNYLGNNLLQHFHRTMKGDASQDMLLNRDGYWLIGTKREDEWGFMLGKSERSLTARRVPRTDVAAPVRSEAGEYLELAVADNGPGIAPESLPRLFQPFVQGDGRLNRSHGGTGIGLTLVKLLAELHGGGSGVESEPGNGAKFLVWLPCDSISAPKMNL